MAQAPNLVLVAQIFRVRFEPANVMNVARRVEPAVLAERAFAEDEEAEPLPAFRRVETAVRGVASGAVDFPLKDQPGGGRTGRDV
jgi:hypothetical protein